MGLLKKAMMFVLMLAVLVISPRLFVFMIVALAPFLVAFLVDRSAGKTVSTTVGLFNIGGFSIYAIGMLDKAASFSNMTDALDPFKLMIVYLFAAIGWFVIWFVPKMTITFCEYRDEMRIKAIKTKLNQLEEEWSPQVRG